MHCRDQYNRSNAGLARQPVDSKSKSLYRERLQSRYTGPFDRDAIYIFPARTFAMGIELIPAFQSCSAGHLRRYEAG